MAWPGVAAGVAVLPLTAAAALAVVPARRAPVISLAVAGATLLGAGSLPWLSATLLGAHLAILAAFIGFAAAWTGLRQARHRPAVLQAVVGAVLVAVLSDHAGLTWAALAAAALLSASLQPGRSLLPTAAAVLVALLGTVLLLQAAEPDAGWAALEWTRLMAAAQPLDAGRLALAFPLMLVGYGAMAGLAPIHAGRDGAAARVLIPAAALSVILRLRIVVAGHPDAAAPGPPLLALGVAALLLGAAGLWRSRGFAASVTSQSGLVAVAFGLDSPAATFAGLLHLTGYSLAHAALGQRMPRPLFAALLIAAAGLPPFALFSSEALILGEAARRLPLLAVLIAVGLLAVAAALSARLRSSPALGAPQGWPALVGVWLPLAALLGLGAAMPSGVAAWLRAVAAAP